MAYGDYGDYSDYDQGQAGRDLADGWGGRDTSQRDSNNAQINQNEVARVAAEIASIPPEVARQINLDVESALARSPELFGRDQSDQAEIAGWRQLPFDQLTTGQRVGQIAGNLFGLEYQPGYSASGESSTRWGLDPVGALGFLAAGPLGGGLGSTLHGFAGDPASIDLGYASSDEMVSPFAEQSGPPAFGGLPQFMASGAGRGSGAQPYPNDVQGRWSETHSGPAQVMPSAGVAPVNAPGAPSVPKVAAQEPAAIAGPLEGQLNWLRYGSGPERVMYRPPAGFYS